jgi:2-iminobutanoate/2-iminopropanoate deaminase
MKVPAAIGPYSVGVEAGNFVFTAGQLGLDPTSGDLVAGGIEAQTRQALTNIRNILEAAGLSMDAVIKTTVFLRDMQEFNAMNSVYGEFFKVDPPARTTVQVAALPKNAAIEIEVIAIQ